MKHLSKLAAFFVAMVVVLGFASCKGDVKVEYVDKKADEIAPAKVTNLKATAKDSRVLLTWTEANDEDVYGYEVSYNGTSPINRVVLPAMDSKTMIVGKGSDGCYVSGLKNGTAYTFTVKTIDTSGNKSEGVSVNATPVANSAEASGVMQIALTASVPHENGYTGDKSNTKVTVTANITTASNVKKVVWKKDGSLIAKTLLADTEATTATETDDNALWTFDIIATDETANGNYTVAAIDEVGREEAEQIVIEKFDFTAPKRVQIENAVYSSELSAIILNWNEPSAEDYNHVIITYTVNNGTEDSEPSEPVTVAKGTTSKTFTGIDGNADYYTYILVSVDALGNKSAERIHMVSVNKIVKNIPEGFVEVEGTTINGDESWTPSSEVYVSGRKLTIPDLFVCDHEVTRGEFKEVMGIDPSTAVAYDKDGNLLTGDDVLKNPVNYINWYGAIVYCNKLSVKEGLNCVYTVSGITDWEKFEYSRIPTSENSIWNAASCDFEANGYRLPTEAEWEWLARGGENYTYSGSNTIGDVAWYSGNTNYTGTRDVKTKNANAYGLYDMSGNVCEWCWDWNESISSTTAATGADPASCRILRGGSWGSDITFVPDYTVSHRGGSWPEDRDAEYGFRVVRNAK